jgi:hypothetical protein
LVYQRCFLEWREALDSAGLFELQKAILLIPNDRKLSEIRLRGRKKLTGDRLSFLGALAGSTGAFLSYELLHSSLWIILPLPLILVCLVAGALLGLGVTSLADKYDRFRGAAIVIAACMGLTVPIWFVTIFSLLSGPT